MTPRELANQIMDILESKNASNILGLDVAHLTSITEYFIIASGENERQVEALSDAVDEALGKAGYELKQTEGYRSANWILLDYGDLVIHLFDTQNRLFYDLERIWRDGAETTIEDLEKENDSNGD